METCVLFVTAMFSVFFITTAQKQAEFLEAHNYFRAKEGAKDMQAMTWSRAIKKTAATWAQECLWDHSPSSDRKITWGGKQVSVGENLFWSSAKTLNVTKVVNIWYDEKDDYNFKEGSCARGEVCGHYTQVVWSTSNKLGCAAVSCQPLYKLKDDKRVKLTSLAWLVVCQYAPGGNIKDKKPYTRGTRCLRCPEGTTCDSRKLCVKDKKRELNLLLEALYQLKDFEENSNEE
ncbi:GLIPR1-like protein 1 [Pecten maximus]|uniref:GLIPR1-like protein 1 n=1 Tax=Pecten maximus TaxID=6579 RepID=UPI001457F69A|nr:GLIPR1-like protein 1 [Pecten maximus]